MTEKGEADLSGVARYYRMAGLPAKKAVEMAARQAADTMTRYITQGMISATVEAMEAGGGGKGMKTYTVGPSRPVRVPLGSWKYSNEFVVRANGFEIACPRTRFQAGAAAPDPRRGPTPLARRRVRAVPRQGPVRLPDLPRTARGGCPDRGPDDARALLRRADLVGRQLDAGRGEAEVPVRKPVRMPVPAGGPGGSAAERRLNLHRLFSGRRPGGGCRRLPPGKTLTSSAGPVWFR